VRLGVFFTARRWTGQPVNAEPHLCTELGWHPLDHLPGDTVSYIRTALLASATGIPFSLDSWT
jgi:hypothetical protein